MGLSFPVGGAGGCAGAVRSGRSGKAGRLWALCRWGGAGAGAWSSWAVACCWRGHLVRRWRGLSFPVQVVGGAICCGCGVLAWSSWQRRQHPARAGLLIQQAGQAGRRRKRKRPGRRRVVRCCSGLLSALAVRSAAPGASRCISWAAGSAPRSGAGLLALALIRAQRFQLATFQRGTACAGGAPSGAFLPFAGGVRFSILPGSALGVGLELSGL